MSTFALIGAAGFIAPRHMKAIKDTGNELIAALDLIDSVGILDSHFPDCKFFTEFSLFDDFCKRTKPDYISICSPNYLHLFHCKYALSIGSIPICEKPLVLSLNELFDLKQCSRTCNIPVYTVMQLRLNPTLIDLKQSIGRHYVGTADIDYYTPRGHWYSQSWKSDSKKSGGLAFAIGIHLFDVATWLFGEANDIFMQQKNDDCMEGWLLLQQANVHFHLAINETVYNRHKTKATKSLNSRRIITINNRQSFDMSAGFVDAHTRVYQDILSGNGLCIDDAKKSIGVAEIITKHPHSLWEIPRDALR